MGKIILGFCILALLIPLTSAALVPGEGIVLDPNTGDYIVTYANAVGRLKQVRFIPSTKIDPTLRSRFETQHNLIHYRYTISNGSNGKQPLIGFIIDPISSIHSNTVLPSSGQEFLQSVRQLESDTVRLGQYVNAASSATETPSGWSCDVLPNGDAIRTNFRIACLFGDLDEGKSKGLQVGRSLAGFGLFSLDLPGVGVVCLDGFGDTVPGYQDEGPDGEISDQVDQLVKNDFVPRNAAVPTIAVPTPFDPAILLDRIRTEAATWSGKQLTDPAYAAQLDRYLAAAADAFRLNNAKAGREHIETLRKMLAREHHYLDHDDEDNDDTPEHKAATRNTIDRLAARVLDFDLKYVLKRMRHDGEENDGKKSREETKKER